MQVGDVGTAVTLTIFDQDGAIVNLASATLLVISFRKPSGLTANKLATLVTDGTDGQMRYVTISGDLNEDGIWELQAVITMPSGKWYSEVKRVPVGPQIPGA